LKGITTRSGVAYKGPTIPTPFKVVKQCTEATKDQVQTPNPQSTAHVQPPVTQSETSVSEPIAAPEVLGFSNVTVNGSPTPSDDPIVSTTSPMLTLFGDSNFLLFEEANAFLGLEDDPDSPKLDPSYYDPVLKYHKRAIAWKMSDIQGINPEFCTHKILMEEDYK
nr:reverse transcriptase domain-containing protein [Tanacetum cinerariifolium]